MPFKSSYFLVLVLIIALVPNSECNRRKRDGEEEPPPPETETEVEETEKTEDEKVVKEGEPEITIEVVTTPPEPDSETKAGPVFSAETVAEKETESSAIFKGVPRTELTTPTPWIKKAIETHNNLRERHEAEPLVFNKTLCEISQSYANFMAESGTKNHNKQRGELGENLYWSSNSIVMDLDAVTPVQTWYDEIKDYDFVTTNSRNNNPVLHFTQVVWKGTKEVGIAHATETKPRNGMYTTYVVANYYPRGNWDDFHVNVVPVSEKFKNATPKPTVPSKPKPGDSTEKDGEPTKETPGSAGESRQASLSFSLGCTMFIYVVSSITNCYY